ncbi:MAG: lasso peptide biosynthesis protein [Proteobacteria bacterium]|nr:lasso peptide biosynthesis protein [Pseudomonadota bacterium]
MALLTAVQGPGCQRIVGRLRRVAGLSRATLRCVCHPRLAWAVMTLRLTLPRALEREPLDQLAERLRRPGTAPPWGEALIGEVTDLLLRPPSPLRTTCLFRALVRYALLAPHDPRLRLFVGLRPAPAGGGHAWLAREGQPILSDSPEGCVPTFVHPH